ncbi:MAG: hypothetical protein NC181_03610 [Clostridium sp.]|nr:hypothetical protein [Clostridium sp.]MCM1444401.1 hypothetical protein [Candidatus Amulumruptor caecigallinarius]
MRKFLVLLTVTLILTGCGCEKDKKQDDPLANIPNDVDEVTKDKVIYDNSFKISNVLVTTFDDGTATYNFDVQNITDKEIKVSGLKIYFKDKDGNNLLKEPEYKVITLTNKFAPGEIQGMSLLVMSKFENLYSIEYEVIE